MRTPSMIRIQTKRPRLLAALLLALALLLPQFLGAQTATQPAAGDGTTGNPYQIATAENLAWFRDQVKAGSTGICAVLTQDIDMTPACHPSGDDSSELNWTPIGTEDKPYTGQFHGQGHTLSEIYFVNDIAKFENSVQNVGLFGCVKDAVVEDIILENPTIVRKTKSTTSSIVVGIVAGKADNSILRGIKVTGGKMSADQTFYLTSKKTNQAGAIVGWIDNGSTVEDCENHAAVAGKVSYLGGIVGQCSGNSTIRGCTNWNTVSGKNCVGGIVGYLEESTVVDCSNHGQAISQSSSKGVGGVAGKTQGGSLKNVLSTADISLSSTGGPLYGGLFVGIAESATADGLLAYSGSAKIWDTDKNQTVTTKTVGNGSLTPATGKTIADIVRRFTDNEMASGCVAWLLNGETDTPAEGEQLVWYQRLGSGGDACPVLQANDNSIVYHGTDCGTEKDIYTNTSSLFADDGKRHHYGMSEESVDEAGLHRSICQRCNEKEETNARYIKDFCGKSGYNLRLSVEDDGSYKAEGFVTIADPEEYNSPVDFLAPSLAYVRGFSSAAWQPVYLPFALPTDRLPQGFRVATINNFHEYDLAEGRRVELEVELATGGDEIPAFTPCLIRDEKFSGMVDVLNFTVTDARLYAAETKTIDCWSLSSYYLFTGTCEGKTSFDNTKDFVMKDGQLWRAAPTAKLKPQRWWLTATKRSNAQTAAPLTSIAIRVAGEATAIHDMLIPGCETGAEQASPAIYDLYGCRLSGEPVRGVYIKDGKKQVK